MSDSDPTTRRTPDVTIEKDEWRTPPELFAGLDFEFRFTLDVAATEENALCPRYLTAEENALIQSWKEERVFVNPPYRRGELARWTRKAMLEACTGPILERATVVALLPATRTEQAWWHDYVLKPRAEIRWLRGRLHYLLPDGSRGSAASFPSVIVIWR